jgi:plasmid stabilization system protein ParE
MNIRFLDAAEWELDEAIAYYNSEAAGLGDKFLLEVLATIERIRNYPSAWQPLSENTRRCRLRRYPYGIIYQVDDEGVLVIAVTHLHRHPEHWRTRVCL